MEENMGNCVVVVVWENGKMVMCQVVVERPKKKKRKKERKI